MNSSPPGVPSGSLLGQRVLIVDDDPDTLELVAFILDLEGAVVRTASDAAEAFQVLEAFQPNLLISDINMPEVDGLTFIRQIRQTQTKDALPAIALTAQARFQDSAQALEAGYQLHLTKPILPEDLIAAVIRLISSQSRDSEA